MDSPVPIKSNVLKNMLTGKDNSTYDVIRCLGFFGGIAMVIFEGYVIYHTKTFDVTNFGIGFAGLLTSIGAATKIKETTEPSA